MLIYLPLNKHEQRNELPYKKFSTITCPERYDPILSPTQKLKNKSSASHSFPLEFQKLTISSIVLREHENTEILTIICVGDVAQFFFILFEKYIEHMS